MSGPELMSARARLNMHAEQLGHELLVDADRVAAWEGGDRAIPGIVAQRIRWLLANDERAKAVAASGLPECAWVQAWGKAVPPIDDPDATLKHLESLERHSADCHTCRARDAYIAQRFAPLAPYPLEGRTRILAWVFERFEALPPWLRPPVWGAAILGGIVALRFLFALPRLLRAPQQLAEALVALAAAAGAGAAGGTVYALTRPPLRRLGRLGDYLSGIAAVGGYLGALILVAPIAFGESLLEGPGGWIVWVIASVGFGLVVGHSWFGAKGG